MRSALLSSALFALLSCAPRAAHAESGDVSDDVLRWVLAQNAGAALVTFQVRRAVSVRCPGCAAYDLADVRTLVGAAWAAGRTMWRDEPALETGRTYVVAWGEACRPHVLEMHVLTNRPAFENAVAARLAQIRAERPAKPAPERVCRRPGPARRKPVLD